jgi:hypothetical protein
MQFIHAKLLGADPVDGRQPTVEHKVAPAKSARLLDGEDVRGGFYDAKQSVITPGIPAVIAQLVFTQISTGAAAPDTLDRFRQRARQYTGACPVSLQNVQGHALSALGTYTGQYLKRLNQLVY